MALSISPVELWDFQAASNPLVGTVAGTTLVSQNGAVVSTANGLELNVSADAFFRVGSIPAGLNTGSLPFTVVMVLERKAGPGNNSFHQLLARRTSGFTTIWNINHQNDNAPAASSFQIAGIGDQQFPATTQTVDTEAVYTVTWTSAKVEAWQNTTQIANATNGSAASAPTLNASDRIEFGQNFGDHPGVFFRACGFYNGALSSQDRTDLAANWRTALFSPAASARFRPYFITG